MFPVRAVPRRKTKIVINNLPKLPDTSRRGNEYGGYGKEEKGNTQRVKKTPSRISKTQKRLSRIEENLPGNPDRIVRGLHI
jgi:hypothetical protein